MTQLTLPLQITLSPYFSVCLKYNISTLQHIFIKLNASN